MVNVLVKIRLEDFDKWKPGFDEYADFRSEHGVLGTQVFRNADNPHEVLILYEWDDLDRAWDFYKSPKNQKMIKEAGLQGKPNIFELKEKELPFNPEK